MAASSIPIPKTLFVVGAGASKEANLPIGSELKQSISRVLDIRFERGHTMNSGDDVICNAFRIAVQSNNPPSQDINPFLHASWRIRDAMPQAISIDNFIDAHSDDKRIELCGKLAIVRTILEAESKSSLFVDPSRGDNKLKFSQLENTWFSSFWQLLFENCKLSDIEQRLSSVALVIFNYDRCIEHYLYHALQNYYSISASDVAKLLKRLEIYHPYGTVGALPWLSSQNAIGYGATPHPKQLLELANQIKTFTEGTDVLSSEVNSIRSNMKMSPRLVFLGFAFHKLNMELLLPTLASPDSPTGQSIFATAYGISTSGIESISAELVAKGALSVGNIRIRNDLTCSQLFREYWRSMSFV